MPVGLRWSRAGTARGWAARPGAGQLWLLVAPCREPPGRAEEERVRRGSAPRRGYLSGITPRCGPRSRHFPGEPRRPSAAEEGRAECGPAGACSCGAAVTAGNGRLHPRVVLGRSPLAPASFPQRGEEPCPISVELLRESWVDLTSFNR